MSISNENVNTAVSSIKSVAGEKAEVGFNTIKTAFDKWEETKSADEGTGESGSDMLSMIKGALPLIGIAAVAGIGAYVVWRNRVALQKLVETGAHRSLDVLKLANPSAILGKAKDIAS